MCALQSVDIVLFVGFRGAFDFLSRVSSSPAHVISALAVKDGKSGERTPSGTRPTQPSSGSHFLIVPWHFFVRILPCPHPREKKIAGATI
jgi:hypothetical protein